MKIIVSASKIGRYQQCKRRYQLHRQGWEEIDISPNLYVGRAIHRAVQFYHLSKNQEEAFFEGFKELPADDDGTLRDIVYATLVVYFEDLKKNPLTVVSTETGDGLIIPLNDEIGYRLRMDGLVNDDGFRVLEMKSSGDHPGNFWKRYEMDFQTTGYVWCSRKHFELPVKGALVIAMFKPGGKNKEAMIQRQRITPSEETLSNWLTDTIDIAEEMYRTKEINRFPKSWNCINSWNQRCEFLPYCSNDNNLDVLRSTHRLVDRRKP